MANKKLEIKELEEKLSTLPTVKFNNLALCVDGEDKVIETNNSVAIIDGREYWSKEMAEKLLIAGKVATVKDDTIYIGRVVGNKTNLFSLSIQSSENYYSQDAITDSYGNNYSNTRYFKSSNYGEHFCTYVLDRKYSLLRISLAIRDNAYLDDSGIITIKADGEVVYVSEKLVKTTEPFTEIDIPINNCMLLEINYKSD